MGICIRSFQGIWMMLIQGLHIQRKVQRKHMVTSPVEHLHLPVGPQWHFHHYVPVPAVPPPWYIFYIVLFSKESQTISISCSKLFNGFFGQTKSQVLIWVDNAFMMRTLDIFPASSSTILCIPGTLSACSSSDRQSTLPLQGLCICSSWECPPMPWFLPHFRSLLRRHLFGDSFADYCI